MTAREFSPGEIWADNRGVPLNAHGGGVLRHEGIYYWFGEHKGEGEAGGRAETGVHVYASDDLCRWRDEGIALAVSNDAASEIARGCILERPKVLYNRATRRFVMWFHLELKGQGYSSARCGVAVASEVTGPYRFVHSFRPDAGAWPANVPEADKRPLTEDELALFRGMEFPGHHISATARELLFRRDFAGGQMARDMTLFEDDDGAAYVIYASEENGSLHLSQLSDDYLSTRGRYVRLFPGEFNEAPAIMKHEGRYFLFTSGCTGWLPNPARLAMAESIWGPWRELGNPCRGDEQQKATTFGSQSTFILPVAERPGLYIFMADRWKADNLIDSRYVWLPIQFENGLPYLEWKDRWTLGSPASF
jgi:hypothetical protein